MLINSEIPTFSILNQYQSHYKRHLFYSYPSFACNPPQPPTPQVPIFNRTLHPTELELPRASNSPLSFFFSFYITNKFGNNTKNQAQPSNQTSKETPKANRSQQKELQIPKDTGSQANPKKKGEK